jgi:hypothetical protein
VGTCSLVQKSSGGRFVFRTIYQDSPYPKECNNMTVFLKIDVPINIDTAITISGFKNASNCRADNIVPIHTATGANEMNFGSSGCGSGTTGSATWDPVNFAVVLYPSSVIAANTIMAFHFALRNPAFGMESPQIHVSLDGGQVIAPTPMWKHTRVTSLSVNASARCFPADVYEQRTANPMIDIVPAMSTNRTTYKAVLETKSRIDVDRNPPKEFFSQCTGTTAHLSVDGVQSVNVAVAGCGCTGQFGQIVAGSPAVW